MARKKMLPPSLAVSRVPQRNRNFSLKQGQVTPVSVGDHSFLKCPLLTQHIPEKVKHSLLTDVF